MDNQRIGNFIRELRKEKELTQREVAEILHITDRAVSKWERGINAPDIALLETLAELLGVTVGELIRGERAHEEESRSDEAKSLLDYSKGEIQRKVGRVRKKYLGLLAGVLALTLLLGGGLLWRSGALFLLDKKAAPDGESMVWVYSKKRGFGPLRFTWEDCVQTVCEQGDERTYISYGSREWDCEYEGVWWSPDGRKYVLSIRGNGERELSLVWLDRHSEWNLKPILNMAEDAEYQFLQWGKDSESMLFYYAAPSVSGQREEGYFWYNCRTGKISGTLELPAIETEK